MVASAQSSEVSPASGGRLRLFVALATALGACLLLWGSLSRGWWDGGGEEARFGVGLRGVELCQAGRCTDRGLAALGEAGDAWERIGIAAFAAGIVAASFLLWAAWCALRQRPLRLPSRLAAGASFFAAAVGTAFVLFAPELEGLTPGYGMAAFYLGAALGAGSALLARAAR